MRWLAVAGFVSTLGQVVLLREASVAFYGVELVYLLAIGAWLLGTACGAAVDRGRAGAPSVTAISALIGVTTLLVASDVVFLRASRRLFGGVPGAYLPFTRQLLALLIATVPAGALSGLMFQWAARRAVASGSSLPVAYAAESLGALAGGAAALVVVRAGLQNLVVSLALLCGGAAVAAACSGRFRTMRLAWIGALALGVGALLWGASLDEGMTRWNHPLLLESRDSPYGRVTFTRSDGQVSVFENDALSFETGTIEAETLAHLAALQHPRPSSAILLGGWAEGVAREIRQHRPARLDVVEANPVLVAMARRHLADRGRADALGPAPIVADPRRHLRDAAPADLVVISQPEPESGEANRFYTAEFFALCAARLTPGGILAFRLHTPEDFWTPAQAQRIASVRAALGTAFREVLILPAGMSVLLASNEPLTADADLLGRRLRERRLETRLVSPAFLRYVYANDRRDQVARLISSSAVQTNTDRSPICYRHALLLWLGRFSPEVARLDPHELLSSSTWHAWLAGAAALSAIGLLALAVRGSTLARRATLAGAAGLAGMLVETSLIVHYQVKRGVVYQDIGILIAMFMVGLSAGTFALARSRERWPGAIDSRLAGMATGVSLAALAMTVWWVVRTGMAAGLTSASLLLAATGAAVGAVFGWTSLAGAPDQRRIIAPLYAADLAGGCIGAVAGGLVLVPFTGLDGTALAGAIVAALALALV